MTKYLVVNADDFGLCRPMNEGIRLGYQEGWLTSVSARVDGVAFEEGIQQILPQCPGIGFGVHLNIVEGHSVRSHISSSPNLCGPDGEFKLAFKDFLLLFNRKKLLSEIEAEYRAQIEKALKVHPVDHLNAHQHTYLFPPIFEIATRLAAEYKIPYIRSPYEKPFFVPQVPYHVSPLFLVNGVKLLLLDSLVRQHRRLAKQFNVKTNDYFIGLLYTGFMDQKTIVHGLKVLHGIDGIAEILVHPCRSTPDQDDTYLSGDRDYVISKFRNWELNAIQDRQLLKDLVQAGWKLTNYLDLAASSNEKSDGLDRSQVVLNRKDPSAPSKLRVFAIVDETPFHHPEYLQRLITECSHMSIVGAAVVVLPHGGVLQSYLLKNWKLLGLTELMKLGIKSTYLKMKGMLPKWMRGYYEGSVQNVLKKFHVPFLVVSDVNNPRFLQYVNSFSPDIILSSNSLFFKEDLLNIPRLGAINRHSALLPSLGGILPAFRALQFKEKYFGVSVHKMTKKLDGGEILARRSFPIQNGDTMDTLYRLAFTLSFDATDEAFKKLRFDEAQGNLPPDNVTSSYYSYPKEEDWKEFRRNGGKFI